MYSLLSMVNVMRSYNINDFFPPNSLLYNMVLLTNKIYSNEYIRHKN